MSRFGRGEKQRHGSRPESGRDSVSGLTPIEVHVPAHGQVTVGGLPVVAGPGESVQDAVLNYLHRLVLATGHAVNATVHDQRIGFSTPLRVVADGSSHFAGEPVPLAGGAVTAAVGTAEDLGRIAAPQQVAHASAPAAIPEPSAAQAPAGVPAPAPEPVVPVAPEPVTAPAPPATPRTAPAATTESVAPSLLAEPVLRINEAVQSGRIESAAAMAEQSIASATKTLGEQHPEVLQLRELAAYIAYLAGDAQRSFALSMDLARIRRRQGDVRAHVNVQSAAAAWRAVRDPSRGLDIGRELIDLWSELAADGGPAAVDIQQLEAARARMGRLTERVRVRRTSQ
ncbi:hypothetical protein PV726_10400 [Streptomyces europaeiscabiei]|uniref:hypothetical protein n=1 Tax=Streptomyces europaeiscabiei TaxID=146819 RepID=UPI0029B9EFDD|nr:hypothetical protein [Streptomyces europaeiscabiei]MDX3690724.1 hypothetical protein [Streptomyces europaeiscabiei]